LIRELESAPDMPAFMQEFADAVKIEQALTPAEASGGTSS
jgi:hypothetical protein